MADYLTTDTELTSVADAIRSKGGTSASLVYPSGFVSAIQAISTGTDVSDTTAAAGDVRTGKYFYTAAGVKAQGSIADQAAQTITPGTTDQTIAAGKYLAGAQTIKGDADLVAGNIKKDVTIFGVTGTFEGGATAEQLNVSQNGTYTAPTGKAYSPVVVNVPGGQDATAEDGIITGTLSGVYENNRVTNIVSGCFSGCSMLTSVTFNACEAVGSYAFANCYKLATANFQSCKTVYQYAFSYCTSLANISFPNCISVYTSAFCNCATLTTADFPNCTDVMQQAFRGCNILETANFPLCTYVGSSAFSGCYSLATTNFEKCKTIYTCAFSYCQRLETISLPSCTTIQASAFARCLRLLSLYLLGSSVATLSNVNAFASTPIAGYTNYTGGVYGSIFVPASLYATYIASTNWATYAARFVSV